MRCALCCVCACALLCLGQAHLARVRAKDRARVSGVWRVEGLWGSGEGPETVLLKPNGSFEGGEWTGVWKLMRSNCEVLDALHDRIVFEAWRGSSIARGRKQGAGAGTEEPPLRVYGSAQLWDRYGKYQQQPCIRGGAVFVRLGLRVRSWTWPVGVLVGVFHGNRVAPPRIRAPRR
jgi:hypothetical protein